MCPSSSPPVINCFMVLYGIIIVCDVNASAEEGIPKYLTAGYWSNINNTNNLQYSIRYLTKELAFSVKWEWSNIQISFHGIWRQMFVRLIKSTSCKIPRSNLTIIANKICLESRVSSLNMRLVSYSQIIKIMVRLSNHYFQILNYFKLNLSFVEFSLSSALQCLDLELLRAKEWVNITTLSKDQKDYRFNALCGRLPSHTWLFSSPTVHITYHINQNLNS